MLLQFIPERTLLTLKNQIKPFFNNYMFKEIQKAVQPTHKATELANQIGYDNGSIEYDNNY